MSTDQLQGLVSPSDIAEIAGVSRAAVSNWRDRRADFPSPAGGSPAKPLFSLAEIVSWLRENNQNVRLDILGGRIWAAMNEVRGFLQPTDSARAVAMFAAIHKAEVAGDIESSFSLNAILSAPLGERGPKIEGAIIALSNTLEFVRGLVPERALEATGYRLDAIVEAVLATEITDLAEALDFVLERTSRTMMKAGGEHGDVDSRTSRLLCSLVSPDATSVYDPACGIAAALLCVEGSRQGVRLVGHEINTGALAMAQVRAFLRERQAEFRLGDVLADDPDPELRVDAIIAEPSFGMRWDAASALTDRRFHYGTPPRSSADLAWIQHALAHLNDEGRAYVLTSPSSTLRGGTEAKIRAALVADGCVEAIVSLPGRMLSHTTIAPTLWVLRRPSPGPILFVDASEVEDVESKAAEWLGESGLDRLSADEVPHVQVDVRDVLAEDAELVPGRWVANEAVDEEEIARQFSSSVSAIASELAKLSLWRTSVKEGLEPATVRVSTVDELIKSRVLDYRPARSGKSGAHAVTPADIKRGTLPVPVGHTRDGEDRTAPGDVLVTTVHEVRAIVDHEGGHVLGPGVERLRVLSPETITPGYLAASLGGSWNGRLMAGATIQRVPVRKLEVPLVSIKVQRQVETMNQAAIDIRRSADRLREEALLFENSVLDAVRFDVALSVRGPHVVTGQDNDMGRDFQ